MDDITFTTMRPELIGQMAALELTCFPTADPDDLLGEREWNAYQRTFPEGVFVAMAGDQVVGVGAGIFLDFDFSVPQHSIVEITGEDQCGNHDPDGDWYYGTDMIVHPDFRRRGIGRRLYELRKDLVRRHGKAGIIAGGHIPGYAEYKHALSAADYVAAVGRGELYDPTLTFQMENGFVPRGVLKDYIHDEAIDNWAALIVWSNPDREATGGSHDNQTKGADR